MNILWAIIIGLIVGVLAKFFMPGRDPGGFIITVLLGIAGAFVASFIGHQMGWYREGQGAGIIASILGAMLLLFIYRIAVGRRRIDAP
jgi:uncharacterized membrane protein YeaQ/YmgE (transglycosylase-associated protein family)